MKFKGLAVAAMAFALIAGNAPKAEANDNGLFGAVIGAATGGFLGSNIGSGKGRGVVDAITNEGDAPAGLVALMNGVQLV